MPSKFPPVQLVKAYRTGVTRLQQHGLTPQLQRLDNEVSQLMENEIKSHIIGYQLTPAGSHSRNATERAIQTFKNHFIAGLSSAHPSFSLRLWDKLIPQAVITLNLLRLSHLNSNLSAYSKMDGPYNYSVHPFAPPVCESSSITYHLNVYRGTFMHQKDTTSDLAFATTDATVFGTPPLKPNVLSKP